MCRRTVIVFDGVSLGRNIGLSPTALCFIIINIPSQLSWYLADCSFKTELGHDFKDNLPNKAEKV